MNNRTGSRTGLVLSAFLGAVATLTTWPISANAAPPSPSRLEVQPDQSADATRSADEAGQDSNALGLIRVGDEKWRVFRGEFRVAVSDEDFFLAVGRPDLAKADRHRLLTLHTFQYGGIGMGVLGAALFVGIFSGVTPHVPLWAPLGLDGAGLVVVLVGEQAYDHPVISQDQADALIRGFNQPVSSQPAREWSWNGSARRFGMQLGASF